MSTRAESNLFEFGTINRSFLFSKGEMMTQPVNENEVVIPVQLTSTVADYAIEMLSRDRWQKDIARDLKERTDNAAWEEENAPVLRQLLLEKLGLSFDEVETGVFESGAVMFVPNHGNLYVCDEVTGYDEDSVVLDGPDIQSNWIKVGIFVEGLRQQEEKDKREEERAKQIRRYGSEEAFVSNTSEGLSKREYFAAAALTGILSGHGTDDLSFDALDKIGKQARNAADGVLRALRH